MKTYKITCWYQMCATVEVDAENLEGAIEKVQRENYQQKMQNL